MEPKTSRRRIPDPTPLRRKKPLRREAQAFGLFQSHGQGILPLALTLTLLSTLFGFSFWVHQQYQLKAIKLLKEFSHEWKRIP